MDGGFDLEQVVGVVLSRPLALVIVGVLLLMSLISLMVAIERFLCFRKMQKATKEFLPVVTNALEGSDLKSALEQTRRYELSHLARVLKGGLREFIDHEARKHEFDLVWTCSCALERASTLTSAELRRGLAVLATVASAAPFVGLA